MHRLFQFWNYCLTFFLFYVWKVLGFMAHETGTQVDKLAVGGPGLAFIGTINLLFLSLLISKIDFSSIAFSFNSLSWRIVNNAISVRKWNLLLLCLFFSIQPLYLWFFSFFLILKMALVFSILFDDVHHRFRQFAFDSRMRLRFDHVDSWHKKNALSNANKIFDVHGIFSSRIAVDN